MAAITGFPPIARGDARVLIVGSMPGERSLAAGQYYAHPGNAFWPLLGAYCGVAPDAGYAQRTRGLRANCIAVWDVLRACEREGSLDAAIVRASIETNDFAALLRRCRAIRTVLCNGGTAHDLFVRRVARVLPGGAALRIERLPSTSPAHASRTAADKQRQWHAALDRALRRS